MRIKIDDVEQSNFFKMPKSIYELDLKPIEREVYMLCIENWRLSISNKWVNENNEIYFYASQEKLSALLRVSRPTIVSAFKRLIEIGLLEVEKDNGNANKYFLIKIDELVKNFDLSKNLTSKKNLQHQSKNLTGTCKKFLHNKELINKNELIRMNYIYISDEFWNTFYEFLDMRKKIKKPATEKAIKLLLSKLEKIKDEAKAIEILEKSIVNNWQDVYGLKEGGTGGSKKYKTSFGRTNDKHNEKTDRSKDGEGWN